MQFEGFPPGTLFTPVPDPLLGPLLEQIDDLAELKVTLRALWLLRHRRPGSPLLPVSALLADGALRRGLPSPDAADPEAAIRRGLDKAVARRTLLLHPPAATDPARQFCLLNTEASRRWLERRAPEGPLAAPDATAPPAAPRPNIFALYEDNVGLVTPLLADKLKEAEALYPWPWIEAAFKIAVTANQRSWRYIEAILQRWDAQGQPTDLPGSQHGDGKPGRYSQKDNRQKYLEEYQRRRGRLPWESGQPGGDR